MSAVCDNLRFGIENAIPDMTLSANPAPQAETPLEWLKNEWRARQVVWDNPGAEIVITGTLPASRVADYFVLSGIGVVGDIDTQLTFYNGGVQVGNETFTSDYVPVSEIPPLGEWRAGIDGYGVARAGGAGDNLVIWLDTPVIYDAFELRIRSEGGGAPTEVRIANLMLGPKLEMLENFGYGAEFTPMTSPALVQVASGAYLPSRVQREARTLRLDLNRMGARDSEAIARMERNLGGRAFLVSAYPERGDWLAKHTTFIARFFNPLTFVHSTAGNHRTRLTIVET